MLLLPFPSSTVRVTSSPDAAAVPFDAAAVVVVDTNSGAPAFSEGASIFVYSTVLPVVDDIVSYKSKLSQTGHFNRGSNKRTLA